MIRIRSARRADLPDVYRVLAAAFPHQPPSLFKRQTERDSTFRFRHLRVAEVDGRVKAVVRIFPRRMLVRGIPISAGGIGSVAAHPDARGLGLASALLHDAIDMMERDGMVLSFLFTGIPGFYERLGWRVVRQPAFEASAREAATMPVVRSYRLRHARANDVRTMLTIYRRATVGETGAIARSERTWRDAQSWLAEDRLGCLIAEHGGQAVAYLRARQRQYGYQILEAEHRHGHEAAVAALLAWAARRAASLGTPLTTSAPADHALAVALRTLRSTRETEDVPFPMMLRIISLDRLAQALLPQWQDRAGRHRGQACALALHAPDQQALTLQVRPSGAQLSRSARGGLALDEAGTAATLFGQTIASNAARPRPPKGVARRIDSVLPPAAFHFWNSDRI